MTHVTLHAADLVWTGAQSREWNTVHSNWTGTGLFQSGDTVRFPAGINNVFIGLDGAPADVSPASVYLEGQNTFTGGNILTGGITNNGTSLTFNNYATGLSFPGGLAMRIPGHRLTFEVIRAPDLARLALGTGPITFTPQCSLSVHVGHGKGVELGNDLFFENQTYLYLEPFYQRTNGTVRFTGDVSLNGWLNIDNNGGNSGRPPGTPGPFPDAFAGRLVLNQASTLALMLNLNGWYGYRPFEISGNIVDGSGAASNRLEFQNYGMFAFRLTGTNTYRHGTYIRSSPSAPKAAIEVGPKSSLGSGDVLVEGLLHLRGNKNIHSNANVRIVQNGQVMIDAGVIVRVKSLQLGSQMHTSGRFNSNNAPNAILGAGELRVGTNQPPTITAIQPPQTVYAGSDVTFAAIPSDPDGNIVRVSFAFYENILVREVTSPPWSVTFSNVSEGLIWYNRVFALDDEGLYTGAGLRDVFVVEPPAPELRNWRVIGTNAFAFDFQTLPGVKYSLETRDDLGRPEWQRGSPFQGAGTVTITNPIPINSNHRYFRIRAGQQ